MFIRQRDTWECDDCHVRDREGVDGYACLSRGATGRVCVVLWFCEHCASKTLDLTKVSTREEAEAWALSVPGGSIDF